MSVVNKSFIFTLYFDFKGKGNGLTRDKEWAERKREDALVYLKRLFENKAQFSCTARDEAKSNGCLLLRGFVNLNSPCTTVYMKRMLGKYSACKPSYFGDMVNLCRFVHVDRNLIVTGRLPHGRKNSVKRQHAFAGDPKIVIKMLVDSIDRKDFERAEVEKRE